MRQRWIVIAIQLATLAVVAEAQGLTAFPIDECRASFAELRASEKATEQATRSPGGLGGSAPTMQSSADLVVGEENGRGKLTYAVRQTSGVHSSAWAVSVDVPFDKTKKEGTFGTLTGLSGDLVTSLEKSWFRWGLDPELYGNRLCGECQSAGFTTLLECSIHGLEKYWSSSGSAGLSSEERAKQAEVRASALLDDLYGKVAGKFWSLQASAGRKARNYFGLDGSKNDEHRVGYSASVIGGLAFTNGAAYGQLIGKHDFKENDGATKCSMIEDSDLESCKTQPLGEADEVDSLVAAIEWRRFLGQLAISPTVAYDFETDEWAAQLPIFFVRDDAGALTGGLKLLWDSAENELSAAIFVTKPLGTTN